MSVADRFFGNKKCIIDCTLHIADDSIILNILKTHHKVQATYTAVTEHSCSHSMARYYAITTNPRAQDQEGNSKEVALYFRHNYSIWRYGCSVWKSGAIWTIHRKYKNFICSSILSKRTSANHETEVPPIHQDSEG